jgi:ubiquinone/menaquinone biosynthesis C-methylase UbiE
VGEGSLSTAEFDSIADVYDDTRRALDDDTLAGIKGMFAKHRCHSILEIGVGTGRVSVPLARSGYEITGVDISRRMMERALAKGISNLVLADGNGTPFRGKSFDATLMAHVFHLLEDPLSVMREAARISKIGVFALVRKRSEDRPWFPFNWGEGPLPPTSESSSSDEATRRFIEERRERFRKIAEKYHWSRDSSLHARNWGREREILEAHPPDDLTMVSDVVVNETIEDRISRFQKGAYGFISSMPAEMREEIVAEMRANVGSLPQWSRQPRHEVYQFALWRSESILQKT